MILTRKYDGHKKQWQGSQEELVDVLIGEIKYMVLAGYTSTYHPKKGETPIKDGWSWTGEECQSMHVWKCGGCVYTLTGN